MLSIQWGETKKQRAAECLFVEASSHNALSEPSQRAMKVSPGSGWVKDQPGRGELCGAGLLDLVGRVGRKWNKPLKANSLSQGKAMAAHSSTLAWEIPWMEEPGRLQSMGSLRVGHD